MIRRSGSDTVWRMGAFDPGYVLVLPKAHSGKRMPLVQVAREHYERDLEKKRKA